MSGNDDVSGADEGLSDELERLRAERERLQARVEALEKRPERRNRLRRILAPILAALTIITFTVAVPGAWARRTTASEDRYVATVAPLASDPRVQQYLATTITTDVFAALNVQQTIANALPDQARFIAAPLTTAARNFVQDQVLKVLQSDAFQRFWVEANRSVHAAVVAILNGQGTTISVQQGKVVLNLLPLVNLALAQIRSVASGLLPFGITIPQIQVTEVPQAAIAKMEQALGVTLPEDFGSIVVFDSSQLAAVQRAVHLFDLLVVWLAVLFVILLVATLWVSVRRRRTLLQVLAGSALGLVLVRRFALATRNHLLGHVRPENRPAATAVTDQIMHSLLWFTGVLLVVALAVIVVALLTGPYPWAVRLRAWVAAIARALVAAPGAVRREPVLAWISGHRDALMFGGAIVALAIFFFFDVSFLGFLIVAVLLALFEVAVFRLAAESPVAANEGAP